MGGGIVALATIMLPLRTAVRVAILVNVYVFLHFNQFPHFGLCVSMIMINLTHL